MRNYQPFHSQEWPRQNFSLQYQYNIRHTSDENKEIYNLGCEWLLDSMPVSPN